MYNLEYLAYMTRQQRGALLDTVKPRHCDSHELSNHDNDNEELDDSETGLFMYPILAYACLTTAPH